MSEGRGTTSRRPTAGEAALAALVATVILALCLGGAQRSRALSVERREVKDREVLAEVAVGVTTDLESSLAAAQSGTGVRSLNAVNIFVPRGSPDVACSSDLPEGLDEVAVAQVLRRSCDSGDPEVGEPIVVDGVTRLPIVVGYFGTGSAPLGAQARRAAIVGWNVAALDLTSSVREHTPRHATARLKEGDTVLGVTGEPTGGLPIQTIDFRGHRLTLQAGDPDPVPLTAPTIFLVVGGLAAAALAAAAVLSSGATRRRLAAERDRALQQVRVVADVAPLVQQSLELADVLPAVAVQLGDRFGLHGIRLSSAVPGAGHVELFSMGARPEARTAVLLPPDHLDAGESLSLALQRGGRSVAVLQLVAGRDLDDRDLGSLRAITELITAAIVNASLYANQQEAVRRLRDLDALKTVFLSTASHELRTPATAIGGFASLLSGSWERFDESQKREFADRIAANARSLGAVVQDLLDFSLLDRGQLDVSLSEIDIGLLVRGVVDRLAPVLPEHEVVCEIAEVPPVSGNHNGLERIITNLLTNASKFSPRGSTVTIAVEDAGDQVAIVVCDEGPGVPAEDRERVFTRFFRGSGEAVLQTRGVGIGLSVVAELTERMGGQVSVDDAPGGGARFRVLLPVAARDSEPLEARDASTV